jgi:hypothetical protein
MAYVNLTNTSGQVDVTLRCSYDRLTKNFAGPLTENACANSECGFLIQDGNKNTGIFVANCSLQFCKNKIELKQDANALITLPANRCFTISGNNSIHSFSCNGTVSFGSGIDANYNGIQSYHPQPSLTLKDTDANAEHAIRFLNSGGQQNFLICQTNTFTCISSTGNLIFNSSGQANSFHISGSNISVSGLPNTGYGFLNYSNSLFSGQSLFLNNTCLCGTGYICTDAQSTGLCVNTKSLFLNEVLICSGFQACNGNISTNCCITGSSGFFNSICSYLNINTPFVNTSGLCVLGNTNISGGVSITGNALISGFSNFNSTTFVNSTGRNLILNSGIGISGDLRLTGALLINPIGLGVNSDHIICGSTIAINSTGIAENANSIFGNTILSGNLNVTGSGRFNSIYSSGSINNLISGDLTIGNNLFACKGISTDNITGTCLIFSDKSISGNFISGENLFQSRSDTVTCFLSTGLNMATNCLGVVGALNTAKAWGRITLIDGIVTQLHGFNAYSHQVYGTASTIVGGTNIYAHGLCFWRPIKYPFSINLNVYPLGNPIITGHTNNIHRTQQLGFSGAAVASAATTTVGCSGSATAHWGAIFYALSGKCASTNTLAPFVWGSCYSEIYFNLMNCKGPHTPYSELTGSNHDGIVNFIIFGA